MSTEPDPLDFNHYLLESDDKNENLSQFVPFTVAEVV